jgi:hypothetical protein
VAVIVDSVTKKAAEIAAVKDDAERDLAAAKPALDAALAALNSISPKVTYLCFCSQKATLMFRHSLSESSLSNIGVLSPHAPISQAWLMQVWLYWHLSLPLQDITSLKALKNPPDVIKRIFDCVLLLRHWWVTRPPASNTEYRHTRLRSA